MINMDSFFNELEKISAQKCRSGSTPIRAHNLAKKTNYDGTDKVRTKLSFIQLGKDILARMGSTGLKAPQTLKTVGLVGSGAVGALAAEQAYNDWSLGRQIRKSQGA